MKLLNQNDKRTIAGQIFDGFLSAVVIVLLSFMVWLVAIFWPVFIVLGLLCFFARSKFDVIGKRTILVSLIVLLSCIILFTVSSFCVGLGGDNCSWSDVLSNIVKAFTNF